MEFPKQFDNISTHVIDDLKITLRKGFEGLDGCSFFINLCFALFYFND